MWLSLRNDSGAYVVAENEFRLSESTELRVAICWWYTHHDRVNRVNICFPVRESRVTECIGCASIAQNGGCKWPEFQ